MSTGTWKELKNEIKRTLTYHDEFPDWPKIVEGLCERIENLEAENKVLCEEVASLELEILRAAEEAEALEEEVNALEAEIEGLRAERDHHRQANEGLRARVAEWEKCCSGYFEARASQVRFVNNSDWRQVGAANREVTKWKDACMALIDAARNQSTERECAEGGG